MRWEEICADPSLQNLPYKIELNREGLILMSLLKTDMPFDKGGSNRSCFVS